MCLYLYVCVCVCGRGRQKFREWGEEENYEEKEEVQ